jgi:hypothetical protein
MLHNEGGGLMAMVKPYAQEGKWNDQMQKGKLLNGENTCEKGRFKKHKIHAFTNLGES